jgi:hypothetical protein
MLFRDARTNPTSYPHPYGLQTTTGGTTSSRPSSVQHTWLKTLLHFGEMRHRAFRMLGRLVGVSGLAVGDGFL